MDGAHWTSGVLWGHVWDSVHGVIAEPVGRVLGEGQLVEVDGYVVVVVVVPGECSIEEVVIGIFSS